MAVETGGNVEGSEADRIIEINGVSIIGLANLPGLVAVTASQMYSANLGNFIGHFWNKDARSFDLKLEDDLIRGALITHAGAIFSETYKRMMNERGE